MPRPTSMNTYIKRVMNDCGLHFIERTSADGKKALNSLVYSLVDKFCRDIRDRLQAAGKKTADVFAVELAVQSLVSKGDIQSRILKQMNSAVSRFSKAPAERNSRSAKAKLNLSVARVDSVLKDFVARKSADAAVAITAVVEAILKHILSQADVIISTSKSGKRQLKNPPKTLTRALLLSVIKAIKNPEKGSYSAALAAIL